MYKDTSSSFSLNFMSELQIQSDLVKTVQKFAVFPAHLVISFIASNTLNSYTHNFVFRMTPNYDLYVSSARRLAVLRSLFLLIKSHFHLQ
jgi:hypothetical protein